MEITTLVFIAFVAIACVVYYLVPKKCQWVVLLVASLLFFVASSGLLTLLMLATTAVVYTSALLIQRQKDTFDSRKKELSREERKELKTQFKKRQKVILIISVIITVAILAFTKYANFLGGIVNGVTGLLLKHSLVPQFSIVLPLGISYYTLMSISYVVDVSRGVITAEKNPLRLLLFVCYFPHIVEGPFDRYSVLDQQFRAPHKFSYDKFISAVVLVLWGFFKKLVVADRLGIYVSSYFANKSETSLIGLGLGTLMFTLQIYTDFSGCIDIVSGVSELFGVKVAENFRQPFFSKSIDEFWRRWHISLGAWLKDYIFYPVSLSSHFKKLNKSASKHIKSKHLASFVPVAYSLFFVWFCNGLWHGTTVKYLVYGLYYYVLMMLGKLCEPLFVKLTTALHINRDGKVFGVFQTLRTFVIVNVGMLLFKVDTLSAFATSIKQALYSLKACDLGWIVPTSFDIKVLIMSIVIVATVSIIIENKYYDRQIFYKYRLDINHAILVVLLVAVLVFGVYGVEYGDAAAIYAEF